MNSIINKLKPLGYSYASVLNKLEDIVNFWVAVQGFTLGIGMIIPIGAQNAFVLNQGVNKNHHITTATLCSVIDACLISLGIFGGGALLSQNETVLTLVTLGGIAFLSYYGYLSIKSAINLQTEDSNGLRALKSRRAVMLGVLAVSLLNPHVYLDTVVILGSIGGQFKENERLLFALGTITASFVWFYTLSIAAFKLAAILSRPRIKMAIDITVALIMFSIAISLTNELWNKYL